MLIEPPPEQDQPKWYVNVTTALCSILIVAVAWRFGGPDAELSATTCLMGNILVVPFRWNQRTNPRFWAVVGIMLLIEFPIAFAIHWPHDSATRLVLFGVAVANALATYSVLRLIEKLRS